MASLRDERGTDAFPEELYEISSFIENERATLEKTTIERYKFSQLAPRNDSKVVKWNK